MVEVPDPVDCISHPSSISYVQNVFEHLGMLWMGIWVHSCPVMPVQIRGYLYNVF